MSDLRCHNLRTINHYIICLLRYDHEMQVARLDYKPLKLDGDNNGDPYDSMVAVQTDIQDFIAGISYQIDTVRLVKFSI